MLFVAMIFLTVGYTAVYAALHGNWQFWIYFFPRKPGASTQTQAVAA